ncbi:MAG: recombinase family protein, partial [Clostridiales bacterium]
LIRTRKKVAAYARVSANTDRLKNSLSNQISYYSKLIQSNLEWEYKGVFSDFAVSGTSIDKREQFNEMIAECEKGNIDIILTKSIQRFARNTVDLLKTVRHLKTLGVEIRFEKENISTFSADGELMLSILASFAQEESKTISENVKWGLRNRMKKGEIGVANKRLIGYIYDEDLRKYVIVEDEVKIIKEMFDMFIDGVSFRNIANILNDKGYRTVRGAKFSMFGVKILVNNEVYAGHTLRQKTYIKDPLKHNKVINYGELPKYFIENTHEAIIDDIAYQKVKAEIKRRKDNASPSYPFTKKIKCGICSKPYTRKVSRTKYGDYAYWFCRAKKIKGITCNSVNYKEMDLYEIVANILEIDKF